MKLNKNFQNLYIKPTRIYCNPNWVIYCWIAFSALKTKETKTLLPSFLLEWSFAQYELIRDSSLKTDIPQEDLSSLNVWIFRFIYTMVVSCKRTFRKQYFTTERFKTCKNSTAEGTSSHLSHWCLTVLFSSPFIVFLQRKLLRYDKAALWSCWALLSKVIMILWVHPCLVRLQWAWTHTAVTKLLLHSHQLLINSWQQFAKKRKKCNTSD